eukprot:4210743-Pyramimonas_sp.AAC.1
MAFAPSRSGSDFDTNPGVTAKINRHPLLLPSPRRRFFLDVGPWGSRTTPQGQPFVLGRF